MSGIFRVSGEWSPWTVAALKLEANVDIH